MSDQTGSTELLFFGCGFVQKHLIGVVEDVADMLHAAILKRWNNDEVKFVERIFDLRVVFHPVERDFMHFENGIYVAFKFSLIRFAVVHRDGSTADLTSDGLEFSSCEREQVGTDWFCLAKDDRVA